MLLALFIFASPALALASDLVVGVVHDSDGYPVAGATVTLLQSGGASAGTAITSADGTFGIDTSGVPASASVQCAYCVGTSVTVARAKPLIVVVKRFAVLRDRGISAADARVLPYATASGMAALMPFTVTNRGSISDRGLADQHGTVVADGIPLYRSSDGQDLGADLPRQQISSISETDPASANSYDARSAGGLFSIDTLDQAAGIARIDSNSGLTGTVRGGNVLRGSFATGGGEYPGTRAVAATTFNVANGTLDVRATSADAGGATGLNGNAFATTYSAPVGTSIINASLTMNRTNDPAGPESDAVVAASLAHAGVTFGVRAQRASALIAFDTGTTYDERAYVEAVHDDGRTRLFASVAAAQSSDSLYDNAAVRGGVLPIATAMTRLTSHFSLHADSVDALIPVPLYTFSGAPMTTSIERSHLLDSGVTFDDGKRLRIDLMAFRDLANGASSETLGGSGISTTWQIAPSLSIRSWVMISRLETIGNVPAYSPGAPGVAYPSSASIFDRDVIWVTAGNALRVDAISRIGHIDGDVSFPIGNQTRLVAGTRRDGVTREMSLGLELP